MALALGTSPESEQKEGLGDLSAVNVRSYSFALYSLLKKLFSFAASLRRSRPLTYQPAHRLGQRVGVPFTNSSSENLSC